MITFREKIYNLTQTIPKGKVATYGQLAKLAGKPKASRAVGLFMRTNPDAPHTPCHRVVAADGSLTGYSGKGGIDGKKQMLVREGVFFKKNRVDLSLSQWER
jgi:O-6-methylguanine DNA methyltransferase